MTASAHRKKKLEKKGRYRERPLLQHSSNTGEWLASCGRPERSSVQWFLFFAGVQLFALSLAVAALAKTLALAPALVCHQRAACPSLCTAASIVSAAAWTAPPPLVADPMLRLLPSGSQPISAENASGAWPRRPVSRRDF